MDIDHTECSSENDSSDERWTPSQDEEDVFDTREDSLEGHLNEKMKEKNAKKLKLSQKVEDLERKKEKKVGQPSQEEISISQRRKISCPLVTCKANVVHLPRHMRNVHHWTKEAASKVLSKYNIRAGRSKEAKTKDYHRRRRCPIADCHSIVQRLSAHLQKVHKLNVGSKVYQDAMLNATVAPDRKHAIIRWQEEHLKTKTWELEKSTQHSAAFSD